MKEPTKVSLVATVKDSALYLGQFLDSVRAQTRRPDEVVVVDGGSTDGTFDILRRAEDVLAVSEPGANIARGRNVAVRAATHEVVAVTDADCILGPDWLERILEPIERGADVSAGSYRPLATSFLQVCLSAHIPDPEELRPGFLPSSRSVAFRREAFEAAGGYPEELDVGEDTYLNHRFVEIGTRIELAPEAVTFWRVRPSLRATWIQYARYARADAAAGLYPERHVARFGAYTFGALAVATRSRWLLGTAALSGAAYIAKPIRRAWRRLPDPPQQLAGLLGVPAAMAFLDAAKMWGYLQGLRKDSNRTEPHLEDSESHPRV